MRSWPMPCSAPAAVLPRPIAARRDEMARPDEVIDFWFAERNRARWFAATPEFDREIAARFGALHGQAAQGALDHWRDSAEGCLALCLLLDQIPRNMFRGEARAFASDA